MMVVWCGMLCCCVVWSGVELYGVLEWNAVVRCGVEWCGVEWCALVWCGVDWCRVE